MWMEILEDGKYKYIERYIDPTTDKQKRVSVILNSNSRQAEKKAFRLLEDKINNKLNKVNSNNTTFNELKLEWWKKYPHTVKPSTATRVSGTIQLLDSYINDDYIVQRIKTPYLQSCIDKMYYEDEYSLSTVKQAKSALSVIFEFAIERGIVEDNPVIRVKIKPKPIKYDEIINVSDMYLEKEEISALIKSMRNRKSTKRYGDLTEFLALTGMRFGEAASLTTNNYNGNKITVDGTLEYQAKKNSSFIKSTPKTKTGYRDIYLSERLIELLNEVISENKLTAALKEDYASFNIIFASVSGIPLHLENYNRQLQKHAESLGINKKITSHIFRHSHISMLAEMGVPLKTIMDRVGHSKPELTLKIYSHVTKKMEDDLLTKLNNIEL